MDISHNGAIAASSSLDAHIRLWDLESGKQIKSMDAGPGKCGPEGKSDMLYIYLYLPHQNTCLDNLIDIMFVWNSNKF